ncbi:hypothetical protein [Nocardia cyriacigeorgica]|uniref:hypothetical protein n=1 Tax=Nocardia cyriacigeorgica TaxID=135487 RepID=UPI001892DD50|nr:hypothetical protein [Nocardia cyriacigeorgica]MBF6497349.1 hypothetical protein [Nocardia cyriacigeorgica]
MANRHPGIELADGYTLLDRHGAAVAVVDDARIAIEGGFLHVQVVDGAAVQIVSAPAVARVDYLSAA